MRHRPADDVLLEIFDFYVDEDMYEVFNLFKKTKNRRVDNAGTRVPTLDMGSVGFQSPRRLNLRLLCTDQMRVSVILNVWPPLPLIIHEFL
jgi:hypothetical protein